MGHQQTRILASRYSYSYYKFHFLSPLSNSSSSIHLHSSLSLSLFSILLQFSPIRSNIFNLSPNKTRLLPKLINLLLNSCSSPYLSFFLSLSVEKSNAIHLSSYPFLSLPHIHTPLACMISRVSGLMTDDRLRGEPFK